MENFGLSEQQPIKTISQVKRENIELAIIHIKQARAHLAKAGVRRAANAVRRALDSVLGAQRHARNKSGEHEIGLRERKIK